MRHGTLCIALIAGAALSSTTTLAQKDRSDALDGPTRFESPQHFAFELRFSPYTPNIDSDPALGNSAPYATVFGTSPNLYAGIELDWQALRIPHLGSLGPGLGAGYTSASGNAQFTRPHNGTLQSGETTALAIYPFSLAAVLRVDVLWRDAGIPLVPYLKVGLGYAIWRASNTLGTSSAQGVSGTGASLGTHVALGLSLNLNAFDSYAAQNFDDAMGVNGTYIFAEWTRDDLTVLGIQNDPLRVGGTNWTFGLALEF
ncbi:MAG: MXAN_2562 family outer membrane beta-barrel protein [Polyangiaceae bacterium]